MLYDDRLQIVRLKEVVCATSWEGLLYGYGNNICANWIMHPCSSDVCLLQFAIESYLFINLNERQDFSCDKAHTNIVLNVMQKN